MCQSLTEEQWVNDVRDQFPEKFKGADVLDIGSGNLNGTYKPFFSQAGCSMYTGIDVVPWNNVDIVSVAHEFKPGKQYDIVFSASQLEHDMHWKKTLKRMTELVKKDGMIIWSAWSEWERHGTVDAQPHTSLTSNLKGKWKDYYHNLRLEELQTEWTQEFLEKTFKKYFMDWNPRNDMNTVFWGIKK